MDSPTRLRIFIPDIGTQPPGMTLPRKAWVRLNRLWPPLRPVSVAQKDKPSTMLSSNVQSIDLPMDCMAWRFWMMRQPNGCSTPAPRSSAAKQWIEELAQMMMMEIQWTQLFGKDVFWIFSIVAAWVLINVYFCPDFVCFLFPYFSLPTFHRFFACRFHGGGCADKWDGFPIKKFSDGFKPFTSVETRQIFASLFRHKKMEAEPSRLNPRKYTANLEYHTSRDTTQSGQLPRNQARISRNIRWPWKLTVRGFPARPASCRSAVASPSFPPSTFPNLLVDALSLTCTQDSPRQPTTTTCL